MKAVVAAFNQEKALVGAFSVITNLRMELFEALIPSHFRCLALVAPCCVQSQSSQPSDADGWGQHLEHLIFYFVTVHKLKFILLSSLFDFDNMIDFPLNLYSIV